MSTKKISQIVVILIFLASTISCDQISKSIVRHKVYNYEQISLLGKYMTLTKVENTGAFLSVGNSLPKGLKIIFLMFIPLIVLGGGFFYMLKKNNLSFWTLMATGFIIGGGIGNIYDRFVYGSVTDFFHIDFVIFQTGIFNMADVSVMVGMFILLGEFYLKRVRLTYNKPDSL